MNGILLPRIAIRPVVLKMAHPPPHHQPLNHHWVPVLLILRPASNAPYDANNQEEGAVEEEGAEEVEEEEEVEEVEEDHQPRLTSTSPNNLPNKHKM